MKAFVFICALLLHSLACAADYGVTIKPDDESPYGLIIAPWLNAAPEKGVDRPARFLEESMRPIDPDVFKRQLEYYNTITDHLASRSGGGNGGGKAPEAAITPAR